jgi:hypothetical protein
LLFTGVLNAQTEKITWDYPVRYGAPEWETLKSYEEQLNAYNIPANIIKNISTEELVKVCLDYPEFMVINAFNNRLIGLNNMMSQFNGFHELFARNDAAKELMKVYSKLDPLAIGKDWTPLQQGRYGFSIIRVELLLAHGMIAKKLDEQDTQILLDEIILKYESKKRRPDVYSLWDLSSTTGLYLCIADKDEKIAKNDANLLLLKRTFMVENIEILNSVFELVKKNNSYEK